MDLSPKSRKRLFRDLERQGWRIEVSTNGWKCYSPDGKKIVTVHQTASEYRHGRNVMSEFRRGGFVPSGK